MPRGGVRPGAGRPKGTGKFGEKTVPVRVPMSMVEEVQAFIEAKGYNVPLFSCKVAAGEPVWADEHIEDYLRLSPDMVRKQEDTFCVTVSGESMLGAGINPGDILVVDRGLRASDGKIVVAAVDGELTVKRLQKANSRVTLLPENIAYEAIEINEENNFHIWGVVTSIIKSAK
ncbi:MAG: DNA polymerase V [Rickettsiales bacterium]|nr:DNA polymerase V [Rickettsiales bacterium]|tara:strand:- start:206 stop:724 length:519 start_codon:yes stop_codon:yes gene_type:complete